MKDEEMAEEYIEKNCKIWEEGELTEMKLLAKRVEELEKENAELKERLELLNLNANIAVRDLNDQLTKAKEIIKGLLPMASNFVFGKLPKLDEEVQIYRQAEQFLKEIENDN